MCTGYVSQPDRLISTKKEGMEFRLMGRGGHFSHIPYVRGPRVAGFDLGRLRILQGVPVFDLQRQCCLPGVLLARGGSSLMCFSNIYYKTYKNMTLVCHLCFK